MTVYQRIDIYIKNRKAFPKLTEHTSIGDRGLRSALKKETLTLKVYIEICNYFKLPYMYFIENEYINESEINFVEEGETKYISKEKESNYQTDVLEKMDKIIELLEKK